MQDVQKRIVAMGRARDTRGILSLMKDLLNFNNSPTEGLNDAKSALTISATFLESFKDDGILNDLYNVSQELTSRYQSLSKIDNVCYSLIKIQLALGLVDFALKSVETFHEPRLRMFTTILERCAERRDRETALKVIDLIKRSDLQVTEREVPLILRCGLRNSDIDDFLKDLSLETEEPYSEAAFDFIQSELLSVSRGIAIPPYGDSVCPVSGIKLQRIVLTDTELDELISMTRSLATEAGNTTREEFDGLLTSQLLELPDVVLDGANIAHVNQNFAYGYFRFDQIQDIFADFVGKACLIVLHSKWLVADRDLTLFPKEDDSEPKRLKKRKKPALPPLGTKADIVVVPEEINYQESTTAPREKSHIIRPVPVDLIEKWRNDHVLFQVPHKLNDDWFWMHICCLAIKGGKSNLLLVSNDLMRDHFWRMQHPKAFNRFVKNHVCKYSIKFGEDGINRYEYFYPTNHSIAMQRHEEIDEDGTRIAIWHIPYRLESGEIRWLVVRLVL